MRLSVRRRYVKALELVEWVLADERCWFCKKPLASTVDRKVLDVTLHHVNEDRIPACRGLLPRPCRHEKALAHRQCHKRHHMQDGHKEGRFTKKQAVRRTVRRPRSHVGTKKRTTRRGR